MTALSVEDAPPPEPGRVASDAPPPEPGRVAREVPPPEPGRPAGQAPSPGPQPTIGECTRSERRLPPEPLGPDSLTWRYFGDWSGLLLGLWAGSLQNMHPGLGAGVEQHSDFFRERWQRLLRSLYPINGVVFDGDRAPATARQVRDFHRRIRGVDRQGRPYAALDPDTFYWAHATFFMSIVVANRLWGDRLSDDDLQRLYAESVAWYRLYGLSMRPVPADWRAFEAYWDHMCTDVLEDTPAARAVLDLADLPRPPGLEWLPEAVWDWLRGPVARGMVWLTVGLYHPAIRARLGYRWHRHDEVALRLFGGLVRQTWGRLPFEWRTHPRARAAWQRACGALPPDAPLPETPARFLPPPEARGDPKHYCPV